MLYVLVPTVTEELQVTNVPCFFLRRGRQRFTWYDLDNIAYYSTTMLYSTLKPFISTIDQWGCGFRRNM